MSDASAAAVSCHYRRELSEGVVVVDEAVAVLAFCACAAYPSCFRLLEIVRYVVNVLVIHTMEFS